MQLQSGMQFSGCTEVFREDGLHTSFCVIFLRHNWWRKNSLPERNLIHTGWNSLICWFHNTEQTKPNFPGHVVLINPSFACVCSLHIAGQVHNAVHVHKIFDWLAWNTDGPSTGGSCRIWSNSTKYNSFQLYRISKWILNKACRIALRRLSVQQCFNLSGDLDDPYSH